MQLNSYVFMLPLYQDEGKMPRHTEMMHSPIEMIFFREPLSKGNTLNLRTGTAYCKEWPIGGETS